MPTIGSLFAGIGGFDLGFTRAGFDVSWQVEIDPWCRKVLERHFPDAERFADIRDCGAHNLKPVDVICGGFPCQDISNAGLRAGIEGERSGLWSEMRRVIGELRPQFALVENVAALLGRGMGRVLGDLAEIGYDAEWEVVSAADVGAPHLRERIWILAYPRHSGICERGFGANVGEDGGIVRGNECYGVSCGQEQEAEGVADASWLQQGRQEQWAEWERVRESGESVNMGDAFQPGLEGYSRGSVGTSGLCGDAADSYIHTQIRTAIARSQCGNWLVEPNVGRVAHGVPKRVDRLRGLGNAVVPQIPEMYARKIAQLLMQN